MLEDLPSLGGNWVDLLILLLLVYYLWDGLERGLILGMVDLASFFISFISAVKFYSFLSPLLIANFSLSRGIANAASFLLVGFSAQILFSSFVSVTAKYIPQRIFQKNWNRWLGFVPSLGSGVILAAFLLTLVISLPVRGGIKEDILTGKLSGFLVGQTQGIERDLKQIFGEAVNETLTFFTINPQSYERVDLHFSQQQVVPSPENEQAMFELINQQRQKVGLHNLTFDNRLRDLAREHAVDMFKRGYFSHYTPEGFSPFERMKAAGIDFLVAGENLALAPSVELAHRGLMESAGHRENILSPEFGKVGIGAIDGGIYGVMFVQEFTD